MSEGRTQSLIDSLAADLEPVRRVPALHTALAVVVGLWAMVFVGYALVRGPVDGLTERFLTSGAFGLVVVGLGLAAFSGAVAGLAAGVPGREVVERRARWLAVAGLSLGLGVALFSTLTGDAVEMPLRLDGVCFSKAIVMAMVPGGVLLGFLSLGWVQHPLRSAAIALLGALALGAVTVHLVCPLPGARHMLIGHLGAPVVMSGLSAIPLGLLLRRFAR